MEFSEQSYIEDERFAVYNDVEKSILDKFRDPVCLGVVNVANLIKKPSECLSCKRIFCYDCTHQLLNAQKDCPICRKRFLIGPLNAKSLNFLLDLTCKCQNYKKGCNFTTALQLLAPHEKQCNFDQAKPFQKNNDSKESSKNLQKPTQIVEINLHADIDPEIMLCCLKCKKTEENELFHNSCGHIFCIDCIKDKIEPAGGKDCLMITCKEPLDNWGLNIFLGRHKSKSQQNQHELLSPAEAIVKNYKFRLDILGFIPKNEQIQIMPSQFDSFALYLKNDGKLDHLLGWYVLDTCLQESSNPEYQVGLRELQENSQVLKALQKLLTPLKNIYALPELKLSKEDEFNLDVKLLAYAEKLRAVVVCLYMLECSATEQWKAVIYAVKKLLQLGAVFSQPFEVLLKRIAGALVLQLSSLLELYACSQLFNNTDLLMRVLLGLVKAVFHEDDIHTIQVKRILEDVIAREETNLNSDQLDSFNGLISKMNICPHGREILDDILKDYKSEELEKRIAENVDVELKAHKWRGIAEWSNSNLINKQFNKFEASHEIWVNFSKMLVAKKNL